MAVRCLRNLRLVKYPAIPALAHVVSGLSKFVPIATIVVDRLLEDIRWALEVNDAAMKQVRTMKHAYLRPHRTIAPCHYQKRRVRISLPVPPLPPRGNSSVGEHI